MHCPTDGLFNGIVPKPSNGNDPDFVRSLLQAGIADAAAIAAIELLPRIGAGLQNLLARFLPRLIRDHIPANYFRALSIAVRPPPPPLLEAVTADGYIVAPRTHGANSAPPKSKLSLLVGWPEAVFSIRSKMRWPHSFTALFAVEDGAAVDVHVFFHALVHRRVGGELHRRRGLAAEQRRGRW